MSGEIVDVDIVKEEFAKNRLQILSGYEPKDNINHNEIGVFFPASATKNLKRSVDESRRGQKEVKRTADSYRLC